MVFRPGQLELIVLMAVAQLEPEAYGVSVHESIRRTTGRDISIGSIYKTLRRLEKRGLVSTRLGEATPVRGGRAKTYYSVEAAGRRAVAETLSQLDHLRAGLGPDWEPA